MKTDWESKNRAKVAVSRYYRRHAIGQEALSLREMMREIDTVAGTAYMAQCTIDEAYRTVKAAQKGIAR